MNTYNDHQSIEADQVQTPNHTTSVFQRRILPAMAAFALLAACSGKGGVEAQEFDSLAQAQLTLTELAVDTEVSDKVSNKIHESLESALPLYKADILEKTDHILKEAGEGSYFVDSDGGSVFIDYIDTDDAGNTVRKFTRSSGSDVLDQAPMEELFVTQNRSGQTEILYTSRDEYIPGGGWVDTQETSLGFDNSFSSRHTYSPPNGIDASDDYISFDDSFAGDTKAGEALDGTLTDLDKIMRFVNALDEAVVAN